MKKIIILLLIVFMAPYAYSADQTMAEKAKAEGKVSFYANITAIQPIMQEFSKNKGVKGEYTRISTAKFIATVLTEHQAGKLLADVLQAPLPIMEFLKNKGVLASYKSHSAAGYPGWTKKG